MTRDPVLIDLENYERTEELNARKDEAVEVQTRFIAESVVKDYDGRREQFLDELRSHDAIMILRDVLDVLRFQDEDECQAVYEIRKALMSRIRFWAEEVAREESAWD